MPDSTFTHHESCPSCGSRDNLSRYTDGHGWCFGCGHYEPSEGEPRGRRERLDHAFLSGEYHALPKRSLTEETCRKFGYRVGEDKGKPVQIADYRDSEGNLVVQKVRYKDKIFRVVGEGKNTPLFGQHLWAAGGKRVVVTEGEIDALSVAQVFNLRWPAVSLPNGAQSAKRSIENAIEWLESFDEVVLMFDMDTPGREAAAACAPLFSPGKCKVAELPLKDANAMLVAGKGAAIVTAIYQARTYRPDGIVTLDEIEERVLANVEIGRPWPWPGLTKATFGRRLGEVYGLGAGTGVGKTDLFTQIIAHDVAQLKVPCGVLYLEQGVGETGRRIAGKTVGRRFHVPDGSWTQDQLAAAWEALKATNRLFLYDSFGAMDWATISAKIRYLVRSLGCEHIFFDHLTAIAAAADDERVALERAMAEIAGMAKELNFALHFVSHLATPEGRPHEEGGRVMIRHFKGSRAIGFWSHGLFGLERNQQADTREERHTTTLRVLKDRYTGQATGKTFRLRYDQDTGRLEEVEGGTDEMRKDESNEDSF